MNKIVIIHGTGGSPEGNWFPWLKERLTAQGHDVLVPVFPTTDGQSLINWKKVFYDQVGSLETNMILIGHSVGAGFLLSLLEESSVSIAATFLVCGFLGELGLPDYDLLNKSFVCREFDWQKIRQNYGYCCLINSDNDPYIPITKGQELAEKLMVPLTILPGAKHINKEAGFTSFPFLLDAMTQCLLDKSKRE